MVYDETTIGLYGIKDIFKLCHLPFLVYKDVYGALALEGSSGTGKTTIIARIGKLNKLATGEDFGVFSADKARYEDFIGCPIPNQDNHEMDMFPMKHAVATKSIILIDEINRADYGNQEKWMSLLSSRRIDGFPVACKYIYVAMNPVMSEGNDIYEGVQPLDKALGERIFGIIKMIPFHEISKTHQLNILKNSFNQTLWEPTEDNIKNHSAFIKKARELYEIYKQKYTDCISEYIYSVSKLLKEETKHITTVEARRAQYILVNILATHALNSVLNPNILLQQSALEALEISFPGRLWEQAVPLPALKRVHKECENLLVIISRSKNKESSTYKDNYFENTVIELRNLIDSGVSKETFSKKINDVCPDKDLNQLEYYVYAYAVVKGLCKNEKIIKEQEFDRFNKIVKKIEAEPRYDELKQAAAKVESTGKFPKNHKYLTCVVIGGSSHKGDDILKIYWSLMSFEVGWYVETVLNSLNKEINSFSELLTLVENLVSLQVLFNNLATKIKDPTSSWLNYD